MADLLDEISEDMRHAEMVAFWKENRLWIIGGVIMAVLITAGISFWRVHEAQQDARQTQALITTLSTGTAQSLESFAAKSDTDHATLARFAAAGVYVRSGQGDKAVKIYNAIAQSGAPHLYRDLAALLAVGQQLDTAKPEDVQAALVPLLRKGNAWRISAMEMQALLYAREKKMKEAADVLAEISADPAAPPDARARAETLHGLYIEAKK